MLRGITCPSHVWHCGWGLSYCCPSCPRTPSSAPTQHPQFGPSFTTAPHTGGNCQQPHLTSSSLPSPGMAPCEQQVQLSLAGPREAEGDAWIQRLAPASIIYKAGWVSHWQLGGGLGEEIVHGLTLTLTLTSSLHPAQWVTSAAEGAGGDSDCRDVWIRGLVQVPCAFPIA